MRQPSNTTEKQHRRDVNDMLHTLRGQQFRHIQNLRGSRAHLTTTPPSSISSQISRFPFALWVSDTDPLSDFTSENNEYPIPTTSGSLVVGQQINAQVKDPRATSGWRLRALSLILPELPSQLGISVAVSAKSGDASTTPHADNRVPSLTNLLLRQIAGLPVDRLTKEIIPYLSSYMRSTLIRLMAVYAPLPQQKLDALMDQEGHTNGEIIIIGPQGSLKDDYFVRGKDCRNVEWRQDTYIEAANETTDLTVLAPNHATSSSSSRQNDLDTFSPTLTIPSLLSSNQEVETDWESDSSCDSNVLHIVILVSTRLSISHLLSLPPTITRLGLINVPFPVSIHRLPSLCPLIVVLDLSYNTWLNPSSSGSSSAGDNPAVPNPGLLPEKPVAGLTLVEKVDWGRWHGLKVLGWRGCFLSEKMVDRVNRGRWDDVEIIS